ncbi:iron-containing redox enzyme family protein [Pseudomonas carnis]|uniref:Iron-containing redox enzyme family protein n=1 Tax=Pseudomonas carnis TaxID=2487355 RepID=A0ABT5RNY0_9PSED|nr:MULTISPECIES: iron-containing redox enzyme family protein [Pseudomonas]MBA1251834.1 iron-containing redox enzyme family protein [Pseudomonas carnis]MBA1266256.1 iron-containing redox enzyme family protein [Pseudomonas carnis]MBA1299902.1 iron-containing redox enzyme family protein [Pseudomonas carnis]MBJ2201450.1 iron-containing redox enzyme family protein [Pseudomonas carnis]MBJ2279232.1 iron-containing redox enzyme family protein [Pseudomonas sp. MF6767]
MTLLTALSGQPASLTDSAQGRHQRVYQQLHGETQDATELAREYLHDQLALVEATDCDLPEAPEQLMAWVEQRCAEVAQAYADYLEQRQQGGPRRYFQNKAHALYFLQCVAPTKQVDGAWLYGLLRYWQDQRFDGLLTTYLEELGDGEAAQNHVVIYRKLLSEHDADSDAGLEDDHYLQGALQLALGVCADEFLPEVIGFNLGYEQLPLHLLITAYELSELGIDPYYFTLHVTIDNASSGHACKAAQSVLNLLPLGEGRADFYRRVAAGYRLNDLGLGTTSIIKQFNLQDEVVAMLERKRTFGQHMHSDYCRFEGQTVNQWLAQPGQIGAFLKALEDKGWIKHNQDPANSRFWQLIEGAGAAMFGVFSGYEKQLIHDWIAGEWVASERVPPVRPGRGSRFSREQHRPADPDTQALAESLCNLPDEQQLNALIPWLSARRHCTPAGLYATRRFIQLRARLR